MSEHEWVDDPKEAKVQVCRRAGCGLRRYDPGGVWQKQRGGKWRSRLCEPLPDCAGSATPPAQSSALERVKDALRCLEADRGDDGVVMLEVRAIRSALDSLVSEVRAEAVAALEHVHARWGRPEYGLFVADVREAIQTGRHRGHPVKRGQQ